MLISYSDFKYGSDYDVIFLLFAIQMIIFRLRKYLWIFFYYKDVHQKPLEKLPISTGVTKFCRTQTVVRILKKKTEIFKSILKETQSVYISKDFLKVIQLLMGWKNI